MTLRARVQNSGIQLCNHTRLCRRAISCANTPSHVFAKPAFGLQLKLESSTQKVQVLQARNNWGCRLISQGDVRSVIVLAHL